MLLADPQDLMDDLGFDSAMTDALAAMTAALNSATPYLEARLMTRFAYNASGNDVFYVKCPTNTEGASLEAARLALFAGGATPGMAQTSFKLRSGFVTLGAVSRVTSMAQFGTSAELAITGLLATPEALEKGVISDFQTWYSGNFVKFTYTSGFPVDGSNSGSYDLTVVPEWLKQLAKVRGKINLFGSPALEEAQVKIDLKTLVSEMNSIIGMHLRYAPNAELPL